MNEEQLIWKGTPSQVLNLPALFLGMIAASALTVAVIFTGLVTGTLAIIVIAVAWSVSLLPWLAKVVATRFHQYEVTDQRFKQITGVFSRRVEVMELYRIKDMELEMPFYFRLFGLSRIIMSTSDRTTPVIVINAIHDGMNVSNQIRNFVEELRDKKRVREVDYEGDELE